MKYPAYLISFISASLKFNLRSKMQHFKKNVGFTLIELLVVIAILGVLAGAVLIAINPLEQLARGRDAGRRTTIQQIGSAVQAYYTNQGAVYPTQGTLWLTTGTAGGTTGLTSAGELKITPSNPTATSYTTGCFTLNVAQNGYCYLTDLTDLTDSTDAVVYARAEGKSSATNAGCTGTQVTWIVWSSAEGKSGLVCTAANTDPAVGVTGLK
jgi:prepilin-type N-terminal cleavage/methylation domain-containing protein